MNQDLPEWPGKAQEIALFWMRRDLRLEDNAALSAALHGAHPVVPLFIFDTAITDALPKPDRRLNLIHTALEKLREQLQSVDSDLLLLCGTPAQLLPALCARWPVRALYFNEDYEPYALRRDQSVRQHLEARNIAVHTCKDSFLFHPNEILKENGKPYLVYTPYSKAWMRRFEAEKETLLLPHPCPARGFAKGMRFGAEAPSKVLKLSATALPKIKVAEETLKNYGARRDMLDADGTSRLSIALRFGLCSLRALLRQATPHWPYMRQLVWREFFQALLYHFPHVVDKPFQPAYGSIPWRTEDAPFERWQRGETGFPIIDAGMRELNNTGYMHNRARMLCANFLSKILLIDWRRGERYFAEKLLDYELGNNNGGWQWAAGTGADAQPYFRIFNPWLQAQKFDPAATYRRQWVPELDSSRYPPPMADYRAARAESLGIFKKTLQANAHRDI